MNAAPTIIRAGTRVYRVDRPQQLGTIVRPERDLYSGIQGYLVRWDKCDRCGAVCAWVFASTVREA